MSVWMSYVQVRLDVLCLWAVGFGLLSRIRTRGSRLLLNPCISRFVMTKKWRKNFFNIKRLCNMYMYIFLDLHEATPNSRRMCCSPQERIFSSSKYEIILFLFLWRFRIWIRIIFESGIEFGTGPDPQFWNSNSEFTSINLQNLYELSYYDSLSLITRD